MPRLRRPSLFTLLAALIVSAVLASPLLAQRHGRRHARRAAHHTSAAMRAARMTAHASDYSLEIVAALFPYDDGVTRGEPVLTLVVENRGTAPAPVFSVDVTQRTRFASFSRSPMSALAPGERAVVQIPLEMTPFGAPCVAVTLDTWSRQGPPSQVYAAAPQASAPMLAAQ
ncbi:MAG TPA: hypothetical protein VGT98_16045 [Candidatus Elarobacter sp.]|nr:hypothetical protein [Candidatus Elarobacter sp.]